MDNTGCANGYDSAEFWDQYAQFLEESRGRHRSAVTSLTFRKTRPRSVLDLGCGAWNSAFDLLYESPSTTKPFSYLGVDLPTVPNDGGHSLLRCDYRRDLGLIQRACAMDPPNVFVSFFSTELSANAEDNLALYHKLFEVFPIDWALVSGFFYSDHPGEETVMEAGGLRSYQTISDLYIGDTFTERRLTLPAPSSLFGPSVVEVFRLLTRG